jgi:hypothetical protein
MKYLRILALAGICLVSASFAHAQGFSVGVGVGPVYGGYYGVAPVCTYGYYDYYPYACAPYGYYGPEWFTGGIFIGAGPWFHQPGWWGGRVFYDRGFRDFHGNGGFRGNGGGNFHGNGGFQGARSFNGGGGFHGNSGGNFHGNGGGFHGNSSHGGSGHGGGRR